MYEVIETIAAGIAFACLVIVWFEACESDWPRRLIGSCVRFFSWLRSA
jgi:hypothetical protein